MTDPLIEVTDLVKTYTSSDGEEITAVNDVSFSLPPNAVTGILGPNGAGKTTIMKTLLGLVTPTEGTITFRGEPIERLGANRYDEISGMLEGARNVYWRLTVRENVAYFASLHGIDPTDRRRRHNTLLEELELADKADEPVQELSRGLQQKTKLACTLARETPVVVLDEPTLGLDVPAQNALKSRLRDAVETGDKTILLSSHDMDIVQEVCDRVIIISDGQKILEQTMEEVVGLFETESYEVEVPRPLSTATEQRLKSVCEVVRSERNGTHELEVLVDETTDMHDVVSVFEQDAVFPSRIAERGPSLEKSFVTIIEDKSTNQR